MKMVKRSRGFRSKTRHLLKGRRKRTTITERLKEFNVGQKIAIKINPSIHKGTPHPRYYGKIGEIKEKRGKSYLIKIKDKNKVKTLISRPEHMKVIK